MSLARASCPRWRWHLARDRFISNELFLFSARIANPRERVAYIFENLEEVRSVTEEWVKDYNYERPHDSLGGLSPVMWKNGQQAQAKASTFPARFSTSDNNSSKISRKNSTFEAY